MHSVHPCLLNYWVKGSADGNQGEIKIKRPRNIHQNITHNCLSWVENLELSFPEAKQRRKVPSLQNSQCSWDSVPQLFNRGTTKVWEKFLLRPTKRAPSSKGTIKLVWVVSVGFTGSLRGTLPLSSLGCMRSDCWSPGSPMGKGQRGLTFSVHTCT